MKTFYLAGPYGERVLLGRLAFDLAKQERARWYGDHDWTTDANQVDYTDPIAPLFSIRDLAGAAQADLFVLWRSETVSLGSHAELGARLAHQREAHVILNGQQPHMFYRHPLVRLHDTWSALLLWLREDALGVTSNAPPPAACPRAGHSGTTERCRECGP